MKKHLFLFCFILISFFSFSSSVNANVHTGISYDAHEKFNIFYEIKQNTSMANFLLSKDINGLSSYLDTTLAYATIHYASDLEPYLLDGKTFPINTKYVIIYSSSHHDNTSILKKNGSSYTTSFRFININYQIAFFDNQANQLISSTDYLQYYVGDISPEFTYNFDGTSKKDIEDFSYFISHLWYYEKMYTEGLFDKTYVTDIIYDDERLLIDDSKVNENIFTKIKNSWLNLVNSDSLIDAENLNLKFFQENHYMTDIKQPSSMYHILNYTNSITPPSGFKSLNFQQDNKRVDGYLFIPNPNYTNQNRNLYGYTSDFPRQSFVNDSNFKIKQAVSGFSIKDNNLSALSEKNADYHFSYSSNNKLYDLDYQTKLSKKYPDFNSSTYAVWVSHAIKYDTVLYYNPKAFQVCPLYTTGTTTDSETGATIITYNNCKYINPITKEEVTLSGEQFYNTISSTNTIGASSNITDDADTQNELAKEYSELYDYNEDGSIKGFNVSNILNEVKSFLNTFIGVITTMFASFTMFFNALPLEVRGLLYFSLVGGIIILFWKLIH